MASPLKLPRLHLGIPIVGQDGKPTRDFSRYWDEHCTLLEDAINGLITVEAQATAAQSASAETASRLSSLEPAVAQVTGELSRLSSDLLVLIPPQSGVSATISGVGSLASAHLFVGNGSNIATDTAVTGDVTISNVGVTTIGAGKVTEAMQVLADNTTQDVSTTKHGYAPKAPNDATVFLNGQGAYTSPSASAGGALSLINSATPTGTGVVTFSSIPATFKHLLVVASGRSTAGSSPGVNIQLTFNNDTGANYDYETVQIVNTTVSSNTAAAQASITTMGLIPWSGATASNAGWGRAEIFNYAGTSLFKGCRISRGSLGATTIGASAVAMDGYAQWRSAAAINRIDLTLSAGNWDTGSQVTLYGLS